MLAEGPDCSFAQFGVTRPSGCKRAIEHRGIVRERAIGPNERAFREGLAAPTPHGGLAFGDERGGKVEHSRFGALAWDRDAKWRGRKTPLYPAERRDDD